MRKTGKVFLVGAGPGDPGLLTVHGRALLERCDAVVFDALVHPAILRWARRDAQMIFAGKRGTRTSFLGHRPSAAQRAINEILVSLARRGKAVVRLKGGDPFLFGRGGEEAEHLARHKIPFEVVPGVSSVTAVPAYAGIPVTDRRCNSILTIVTGHSKEDYYEGPRLDWKRISPEGTLVILMGAGKMEEILKKLLDLGWPGSLPACGIQWGTLPRQRTVVGTLGSFYRRLKEGRLSLESPSTIVIGNVVRMRRWIRWFKEGSSR